MEARRRHPRFFKALLPGFRVKLLIPREFGRHIMGDGDREATLMSPLRKPWRVTIHADGEDMYFGDGWREVAEAHDLRVGYVLVFCYHGDMVFSFRVYDLSACEKDYDPIRTRTARRETTDVKEDQTSRKVPKKRKRRATKLSCEEMNVELRRSRKRFNAKKPHLFEALIYRSNLSWKQLNIPVEFKLSNGLVEDRDVILVDPEGRSWPVSLRLGTQDGVVNYRPVFGIGWREFAVNNNLGLGDKCIFELVSKEKGEIHVQILRRTVQ